MASTLMMTPSIWHVSLALIVKLHLSPSIPWGQLCTLNHMYQPVKNGTQVKKCYAQESKVVRRNEDHTVSYVWNDKLADLFCYKRRGKGTDQVEWRDQGWTWQDLMCKQFKGVLWMTYSAVNIATTYWDDVDQLNSKKKVSRILSNEWYLKVMPEEIACKWNIGIQTAKDTIWVMTQCRIWTALHPMMQQVHVDHLHLQRQQLKGMWYTAHCFLR